MHQVFVTVYSLCNPLLCLFEEKIKVWETYEVQNVRC